MGTSNLSGLRNTAPAAALFEALAALSEAERNAVLDSLTPDELAVLERDAAAAVSLREFVRLAWSTLEPANPFVPGWHLDCICEHLEAVTSGEIRNLLINVPPRHAKSLTVSVFWPAWVWTFAPAARWLTTSYSAELATRDALKTRRLLVSPFYRARWGHVFRLSGDQNVKTRYENDRTGHRVATGTGGQATGEGGDYVLADDPHKTQEAESDAERESVLTWWSETMASRLSDPKTGRRVVVMQRLHERDLSGHVLAQGNYHHLCLPARWEPPVYVQGPGGVPTSVRVPAVPQPHDECPVYADPRSHDGELLWPERFGEAELADLERELASSYAVAGQYQQRPVPREGALFKASYFRPLPSDMDERREDGKTFRARLVKVLYFDLAFSERASADYTAGVTVGRDASEQLYVLHVWRERVAEQNLVDVLAAQIVQQRPALVGIEEGAYKQAATQDLVRRLLRRLAEQQVAVAVVPVKVTTDKVFRAQLPASRGQAGTLYADREAPWWAAFEAEVLTFPRGAHDDQVDALAGACQLAIERGNLPPSQDGTYLINAREQPAAGEWDDWAAVAAGMEADVIRRDWRGTGVTRPFGASDR